MELLIFFFFFFQAEDGIRDFHVTGVQTCALPILISRAAEITFRAPSAFTRSKTPGSTNHCSKRPMQLKTPATPSAARCTLPRSVTSPWASATPSGTSSRALAGSRTSATTSSPRSARRRATALPIFPVAPVTRTRIGGAAYPLHTLRRMPRFGESQNPLFRRLNASIGFDRRLGPYDVAQSRAHARALAELGVLTDEELSRLDEGLSTIPDELDGGSFRVSAEDEERKSTRLNSRHVKISY